MPQTETTMNQSVNPVNSSLIPSFQGGGLVNFRTWYTARLDKKDVKLVPSDFTGRVTVAFAVETDGTLSEITLSGSPSDQFTAEMLRIMALSPKWTPGKDADGTPVRTKVKVPIDFK